MKGTMKTTTHIHRGMRLLLLLLALLLTLSACAKKDGGEPAGSEGTNATPTEQPTEEPLPMELEPGSYEVLTDDDRWDVLRFSDLQSLEIFYKRYFANEHQISFVTHDGTGFECSRITYEYYNRSQGEDLLDSVHEPIRLMTYVEIQYKGEAYKIIIMQLLYQSVYSHFNITKDALQEQEWYFSGGWMYGYNFSVEKETLINISIVPVATCSVYDMDPEILEEIMPVVFETLLVFEAKGDINEE